MEWLTDAKLTNWIRDGSEENGPVESATARQSATAFVADAERPHTGGAYAHPFERVQTF